MILIIGRHEPGRSYIAVVCGVLYFCLVTVDVADDAADIVPTCHAELVVYLIFTVAYRGILGFTYQAADTVAKGVVSVDSGNSADIVDYAFKVYSFGVTDDSADFFM